MNIGVFGATGMIGQRVMAEAVLRQHDVAGFARDLGRIPEELARCEWQVANPLDLDQASAAIAGRDVVINAINAGRDVQDTIENAHVLPEAAKVLLTALESHPATRLLVVGGAGSLEVAPGLQVVDTPGFSRRLPDELGVPPAYVGVVEAHRAALELYRLSNRRWTYLSPSAGIIRPGERTGRFRVGGDQLLVSADGRSDISAEDLAIAILDEIEDPRHIQRRFTVGY